MTAPPSSGIDDAAPIDDPAIGDHTHDGEIADRAIELVRVWIDQAAARETRADAVTTRRLTGVVADVGSVKFVMGFVDRVIRPDNDRVAAAHLASLVHSSELPNFLSPVDKMLLRAGAFVGRVLPGIVMPLARRRMRAIVGHLVAPGEPDKLRHHLSDTRSAGYALNVNLLGEAVLGETEAQRRLDELLGLLDQPDVDYVSVKISAVASQLNYFAHDDSLKRVVERLRTLIDRAASVQPATFVNFDMEEYHDLRLTVDAFMTVLDEPEYRHVDAGIVLQAYLPDAMSELQRLVAWANQRKAGGGGEIKIRLVKGANLAMEQVDAAMHGWEQAPYPSKLDVDANYKRCVEWLLDSERMRGVRLGLASHNLFDVAWTHLLATERDVADRVQFEMLQGMAPGHAATVADATNSTSPLLLYTPAVRSKDFDVAISYLFRRLEENADEHNFIRHLFDMHTQPAVFEEQAARFRAATNHIPELGPRRTQDRNRPAAGAYAIGDAFQNEPDTDPTLASNQQWINAVLLMPHEPATTPITSSVDAVDALLQRAGAARSTWAATAPSERRQTLHKVGDALASARGALIAAMMHEANKTFVEADGEVSEAIDFARYYGDRACDLDKAGATFQPVGTIAVVPPWNFPVAIPAGGVLASLAAGNAVVLKPAPETPRCAELIAEACWAAGVPADVMQFVRTADDAAGKRLIMKADAVILTGAAETADLFRSWRADLQLFAETSGKNALIVTPSADIDLAVGDLVASAFGHAGQKCSAASLAILVGDVYESPRFRRQLIDAVQSIAVGAATNIETTMSELIGAPNERLERGLNQLDANEAWLVEPKCLDADQNLWSPGVRVGVKPGSWFHQTECFGPVLGLMHASDLDEAIEIQNSSAFGLTGGIHSLDPDEITAWTARAQVGNGYVNRPITGAIVQRQPFGGWKRSSIGPGAKAGGPNYVTQLGTWHPSTAGDSDGPSAPDDYQTSWEQHFAIDHDPTNLFCEANVFRYRSLDRIALRIGEAAPDRDVERVRAAAAVAGVKCIESHARSESQSDFAKRLPTLNVERVRVVGEETEAALRGAAVNAGIHLATQPVTGVGRIELQHYVREQAISMTLHRFGNVAARPGGPAPLT